MFFKGSRYEQVATRTGTDAQGRPVRYKAIRFIADPPHTEALHVVSENERLDRIANRYYDDPERFWRIADANRAFWPDDLLTPGERLRIPPAQD